VEFLSSHSKVFDKRPFGSDFNESGMVAELLDIHVDDRVVGTLEGRWISSFSIASQCV
jgi:hypothetical protein